MNLDGLTLTVLTKQLANRLMGGQLQKVLQVDKTTMVFKINGPQGNENLVVTVGSSPACYLSRELTDLPKEPTSLCMFLRKHLEGARITSVEQYNGDRILAITADKLELTGEITANTIYVELMGKYSNCIFVQNGVILEALIHVTPLMNRERSIAPKLTYELPPHTERGQIPEYTEQEIAGMLTTFGQGSVGETIRALFNGFGPALMKEVCFEAGVTEKTPVAELTPEQVNDLAHVLHTVGNAIAEATSLYEYRKENGRSQYSPIMLTFPTAGELVTIHEDPSACVATEIAKSGAINTAGRNLERLLQQAVKKEELRHQKISDELADTELTDRYKLYGDLLMINAYLPVRYEKTVTVDNILADPVEPIEIPLQPELTIVDNAQHYYKLYTKLKNRAISGRYQLNQSGQRIDYLQSVLYSLSLAKDKRAVQEIQTECEAAGLLKKSKKPIPYKSDKNALLRFNVDGGEIIVGRNNRENEYITHRYGKPNDLWFHTLQIQGSHVLFRPNQEPTMQQIEQVAKYAAFYSKARESSHVPVDFTYIKYIKKPPASPLGYVIYTNQQTLIVDPKDPTKLEAQKQDA